MTIYNSAVMKRISYIISEIVLLVGITIFGIYNIPLSNAFNKEYHLNIEPYLTDEIALAVDSLSLVKITISCYVTSEYFNYSIFNEPDHNLLGFRLATSSTSKFFFVGDGDYSIVIGNRKNESITVEAYIDTKPLTAIGDGQYAFNETGDVLYYLTLSSNKTLIVDMPKRYYIPTTFFVLESYSLCNIEVYYQDPSVFFIPDETYRVNQDGLTAHVDFSSTPRYFLLSPQYPVPLTLIIIFEVPVKAPMSPIDIFIIVGLVATTGLFCGLREKKKRSKGTGGPRPPGVFPDEEVVSQSYLAATSVDTRSYASMPYIPPVVREAKKKKKIEIER